MDRTKNSILVEYEIRLLGDLLRLRLGLPGAVAVTLKLKVSVNAKPFKLIFDVDSVSLVSVGLAAGHYPFDRCDLEEENRLTDADASQIFHSRNRWSVFGAFLMKFVANVEVCSPLVWVQEPVQLASNSICISCAPQTQTC